MPTSPSPKAEPASLDWPALPTETEIYILPDGRVVIADLPAELALAVAELGAELAIPPAPGNVAFPAAALPL
jgi:hypothetical protein